MPSAKSGGARDVERKHRARNAVRPDGYNDRAIAAYRRLRRSSRDAGGALQEGLDTLLQCMREARTDPGMPPEQRREQTARIAAYVVKAADPKRLIEDLGADLRAAQEDILELEERLRHAPRQHPSGPEGPEAPTRH